MTRPKTITDFRKLGKAKLGGRTAAEAKAVHDARQSLRTSFPPPPAPNRFGERAEGNRARRATETAVPLGTAGHSALVEAQNQFPRLREWSLGAAAAILDRPWQLRETGSNSNWSKKSTFRRGVWVQSYATCEDFQRCVLRLGGRTYTLPAPRGWRWDIDANGLRLRLCSDARVGYHPTAGELLGDLAELPKLARRRQAERQAAAKLERETRAQFRRAERSGLTVCLRDSLAAGNCESGSRNWAARHGLDPARHYRPADVLALANGDRPRVRIVVAKALQRHQRELRQGFCALADHQPQGA